MEWSGRCRRRGGEKNRDLSGEEDRETEGDRECLSSEQNVVIYLVAAKQIRRLPVLWLSRWGAVRFRRICSLSMQQTLNAPAVFFLLSLPLLSALTKHSQTFPLPFLGSILTFLCVLYVYPRMFSGPTQKQKLICQFARFKLQLKQTPWNVKRVSVPCWW